MKRLFSPFLISLLAFLAFNLAHAEKIKVKTVDGVQVVFNPKNPAPPKGVLSRLVLKEDFSLGKGEKEEEMFSVITSFVVDDEGNIYILDQEENQIKVFNREGKYLRIIGRKGQGPGEMNRPVGIHITPAKELLVEDALNQRLSYFSLDGNFLKNVSTAKTLGLAGIVIDSKGNMIAQHIVLSNNKLTREVKKFDMDLNPLFAIGSYDFPNIMAGKINPFSLLNFYEIGKGDSILLNNLEEYEIKVLNSEGKMAKRILKEYEPVRITEEDKKDMMDRLPAEASMVKEMIEFPKVFPPYRGFSLDEQGRMFVETFEKGKNKGEFFYDVFDAEGNYIAKVPLKAHFQVWKGKKLYAVEETEDGFQVLRCYSVRWEK